MTTSDPYILLMESFVDGRVTAEQYHASLTSDVMRENHAVSNVVVSNFIMPYYSISRYFSEMKHDGNLSSWRCYYCGSLVSNNLYKCPSCAGERR